MHGERAAILGLGLMGGSLGMGLKQRTDYRVAAYARREETRSLALSLGAADEVFAVPEQAVRGADVIVLCVPVLAMPGLLESCAGGLKPGAVITDVGSTKQLLVHDLASAAAKRRASFVGSHPIAGSEMQGLDAARADLYEGALVVVTPTPGNLPSDVAKVTDLWTCVGATVRTMDPIEHDRVLARTSHLPHMVASVLAATVGRAEGLEGIGAFCGPGFRDTSRVADGSPEVWRDISESNADCLIAELKCFRQQLEGLLATLEAGNFSGVKDFLARSRQSRRALLQGSSARLDASP